MPVRSSYQPLSAKDAEEQESPDLELPYSPQIPSRRVLFIIIFSETLLLLFMFFRGAQTAKYSWPALIYSPAQDAVEYGVTSYLITGEDPLFHRKPSPQLDAAWDGLYNFGVSQIPKSQAQLLPNKTHPIPQDEGNYIIELDVFHNLHCLNMIRKTLHSDYYSKQEHLMELPHLDHCVDWIRQSLMCAGDTSVVVWQWDPMQQITTFQGSVAHTCRNFEKLREWGQKHKIQTSYDKNVRIEDDIVIPIIPKDFTL
ncbi:hypothetical protein K438DRAFT_1670970 [Mycena galopus ATCC 62051]|nr:hypothetical protein K438DRAFT_1670970 [Mycena galopus ATCC 62051]